jgi:hypothetical protein
MLSDFILAQNFFWANKHNSESQSHSPFNISNRSREWRYNKDFAKLKFHPCLNNIIVLLCIFWSDKQTSEHYKHFSLNHLLWWRTLWNHKQYPEAFAHILNSFIIWQYLFWSHKFISERKLKLKLHQLCIWAFFF